MRRTSLFLALAAILLTAVVGYTYWLSLSKAKPHVKEPPHVDPAYEAIANRGWHESKDDPVTNRPIMRAEASSFRATHDPYTFELKNLSLQLFNKQAGSYTLVKADEAFFDDHSGIMKSQAPVTVIMNIPSAVPVTDAKALARHVHIETTGLIYETKSGKASTDKLVKFVFPQGGGQAVGADYDPNLRTLHLKSAVSLDWVGDGPVANKLHVETSDLVYKELEQKIYLSPWSKMQRQTLTIQAQSSVVTLDDGRLHQIDSVSAAGTDNRNGRLVQYSAANMTALFNEDGALTEIVGEKDARITSTQKNAKTTVTGDRADLTFDVETNTVANKEVSDSQLHAVTADGHAVATSQPLPVPGVLQGDTRILSSNHILLTMRPGGQEVQEINSPTKSNLEFKPNRPGLPHRTLDASKLRVLYGDNSYVQSLIASDVKTRTDKPAAAKSRDGKPPAPSFTWSDEMFTQFKPGSNEIQSIDQKGHFRYEEGDRKASSETAQLIQDVNRITLKDKAHVLDNTGSTYADLILMDQNSGDMDATGHVRSTRMPDKKQKPGTSMLDATQSMQAQADKMVSTDSNTKILYTGNAVVWQGANRISADVIAIDRDDESLHAHGNVVSELVDNRSNSSVANQDAKTVPEPVFTVVHATDLVYHDDTRIALYTGGVTLVRDKMTVTSNQMRAFLTPKTDQNGNQSSLDHAIADGGVKIFEKVADSRTRTGTGDHCEYFTKDDKVVLTGNPQFVDSQKGVTRGKQLTYYSDDDKLIVEGEPKREAFTRMKKK
jgi:lipopolysaccharide export system protein LptA